MILDIKRLKKENQMTDKKKKHLYFYSKVVFVWDTALLFPIHVNGSPNNVKCVVRLKSFLELDDIVEGRLLLVCNICSH